MSSYIRFQVSFAGPKTQWATSMENAKTACFPGDPKTAERRRAMLKAALSETGELDRSNRLIAILYFRDDMNAREISDLLGVSIATIREQLLGVCDAAARAHARLEHEDLLATWTPRPKPKPKPAPKPKAKAKRSKAKKKPVPPAWFNERKDASA